MGDQIHLNKSVSPLPKITDSFGGVMVSVLDSSVIDRGLQKNCIGGVIVSVYHLTFLVWIL